MTMKLSGPRTTKSLPGRPWTKAQFDAIQEIKGKVTDVGVVPEKDCLECRLLSENIELALHAAGVQLYGDDTLGDVLRGTSIFVRFPAGTDMDNAPLLIALKKAGLNPGFGIHPPGSIVPMRTDIPVIFVGERPPVYSQFLYVPPGSTSWTVLPLRKSAP
jgi:hypothetical protein